MFRTAKPNHAPQSDIKTASWNYKSNFEYNSSHDIVTWTMNVKLYNQVCSTSYLMSCSLTQKIKPNIQNHNSIQHSSRQGRFHVVGVVYHRNLVWGSATQTKIKFRYRYWCLNFCYLNRNFLHILFLKFFSCILCLVLNISQVIQSYHVKHFPTIYLIFIVSFVLLNYLLKMF